MAAPAISSVIGRWMLAAMLALMPSVCRCHTALHQHMHDAPVEAAHDELAGPAWGHGHHHHHHGSSHHDHSAASELDDGPAVLAWMISDHHHHESCQCPPMRSCVAQHADDQQRDSGVTASIATRGRVGFDMPSVREVLTRWDRVPQPPRALLHLHCVLLI